MTQTPPKPRAALGYVHPGPVEAGFEHPQGVRFSEDLSFAIRVAGVDAPMYVQTGIETAHAKGGITLTEREFRAQQDRSREARA